MLRKIVIGWVCLLGAIIAAAGLTVQAGIARLRDRLPPDDDKSADPPAADITDRAPEVFVRHLPRSAEVNIRRVI